MVEWYEKAIGIGRYYILIENIIYCKKEKFAEMYKKKLKKLFFNRYVSFSNKRSIFGSVEI